jgi:hypothetical protein
MTYTPDQWNAVLAPAISWRDAYKDVEQQTRSMLGTLRDGDTISSADLVEALYPVEAARGEDALKARTRIFKALSALAERGLGDCCTRGEPVKRRFGMIRPWRWHAPVPGRAVAICAGCGRPL